MKLIGILTIKGESVAKLFFRYGAMNSGKSTALMQVAYNYEERGMRVVILKPGTDTKGGQTVVSRLGVVRKVDGLIGPADNVRDIVAKMEKEGHLSCVLIDEAQFMTEEQVDQLFEVAVLDNIPVICYGLRTDFQMKGFPGSRALLLKAHSIEELKTICRCGRKAVLNARKVNDVFTFEGAQVAIDGSQQTTYESLCGQCYFEEKNKAHTHD